MINQGQLVEGRQVLSRVLLDHGAALSPSDAELIRQKLAEANQSLVFSSRVVPGDPFSAGYTIQQGDLLSRIAPGYKIPYQLIEHVNGIDARRIRVGQKIKLVRGPLHVEVVKSAYRMDVFLGDDPAQRVYVRSFTVGLGEDNSTPVGTWVVRRGGKLANPAWTNPRTGQFFDANDPNNPIGEYWIGLEGADDRTRGLAGYGIHGTVDLTSIGRSASMGCVRMQPQDIELVYNMLVEGYSTVAVKP
jgi:lipoprotein-anchoring transpeptidase ErfK/SrfK